MLIVGVVIGILFALLLYVHVLLSNNEIEKNCLLLSDEITEYYSKAHGDFYEE
ncbi:MAG: hypothetical protein FWE23_02110 [Chitinivibrionia bacterium]|jgi:uncharacterized membrane protein YciS (DUF1049 family)|nr:hypothetical protein [Chitinivibrionia bacterium]